MKKRVVLLTILASAIVGGAAALTTNALSSDRTQSGIDYTMGQVEADENFRLVSNTGTQNILPDFTQAAEKGVKSVVNIDVVKRVAVNNGYGYRGGGGGGGMEDMFEFFFGNPRQQQRQQQQQQPQSPQYQEQRGGGSGVIISEDGYIVSNNHVIEGADEVKITTNDGASYQAKVIGTDPATDIALLKIDAQGLPVMEFGNSDDLRLGEWVLAVGNPYGLTSTVTQGIISAKGRSVGAQRNSKLEIESFIQTDAVVNPGNSGGALITLDGRLIGINTMLYSPTGSYSGYSFAVPSAIVRKVVADIREYGVVQRAMLGIAMGEVTAEWLEKFGKETGIKERGGIYVGEVVENGAAEAAGIKKGDVIIALNDQKVNTASEVQETIGRHRPNDVIKVTIKRDGQVKQIDVTLRNKSGNTDVVKKKEFDLVKTLGAQFREVTDKTKKELGIKYGVQVTALDASGLLARSRVKVGYIITSINDTPVTSVAQLENLNIEEVEIIEGIYPNGMRIAYGALK